MGCAGSGSVLIVEDDEFYAQRVMRRAFAGFAVTIAYNVGQAYAAIGRLDSLLLALVDLNLPGGADFNDEAGTGGGLDLLRPLTVKFPRARVVVFTAHCNKAIVRAAGPDVNFAIKDTNELGRLARWARSAQPRTVDTPDVDFEQWLRASAHPHALTVRQLEIFALAAEGLRQRGIAARLGVSENTIKSHVRPVLNATPYPRVADLVAAYKARSLPAPDATGRVLRRSLARGTGPIRAETLVEQTRGDDNE